MEAELAAENYLKELGYEVHRAMPSKTKIGGKWITRGNDIFGCIDLVAVAPTYPVRFVQVTTPNGVTQRRRKIEKIRWPSQTTEVQIFESRSRRNVQDARRTDYFFRVHDYLPHRQEWGQSPVIAIPESCLPASKRRKEASETEKKE